MYIPRRPREPVQRLFWLEGTGEGDRTDGRLLMRQKRKAPDTFTRHGQRYWCVGQITYLRDGRWVTLEVLETICPVCGRSFLGLATLFGIRQRGWGLIRRRRRHHAPVLPARRKRPPATPAISPGRSN